MPYTLFKPYLPKQIYSLVQVHLVLMLAIIRQGDNNNYIYGTTYDSDFLEPYSGLSMGPFDSGGSYKVVMYANHQGEHTYRFNEKSEINSNGSATFHFECLDSNSSASFSLN